MKFLLLFLMSFSLYAGNYFPSESVGNCETENKSVFTRMDKCQKHYSKTCIDIPSQYSCEYHIAVDEIVDDYTNPSYEAESNAIPCTGEETCLAEIENLVCETPEHMKIIAADYSRVYCTKVLSYPQILSGRKIVIVDEAKKTIWDQEQKEEKDKEKEDKDAKKEAKDYFKNIDCELLPDTGNVILNEFNKNTCNYIKR